MSATQWHPLFGHLLGLSLGEHYSIEPEEKVSTLSRAGDFFVVRLTSGSPPFDGLWSNLTEYNVPGVWGRFVPSLKGSRDRTTAPRTCTS